MYIKIYLISNDGTLKIYTILNMFSYIEEKSPQSNNVAFHRSKLWMWHVYMRHSRYPAAQVISITLLKQTVSVGLETCEL